MINIISKDFDHRSIEITIAMHSEVGIDTRRPKCCEDCTYGQDAGICHNRHLCAHGIVQGRELVAFKWMRRA
jgi:hypothetical protein